MTNDAVYNVKGAAGIWFVYQDNWKLTEHRFKTKDDAKLVVAFLTRGYAIDTAIEKAGVR